MKTQHTVIQRVTDYFGSGYKAAIALGVKHQQYYAWTKKGFLPFKRGEQIEKLTKGEIKAMEIWEEAGKKS